MNRDGIEAEDGRGSAMRLRVMTFNILCRTADPAGWPKRCPLVLAIIRHYRPDLLGVQECMEAQLHQLARGLPEYGALEGPLSGASHLPRWSLGIVPAVGLGGVWAYRQARRSLSRGGRAALALAAAAGIAPFTHPLLTMLTGRERHERGEHCVIFFRRDRWELRESGAYWLSPRPSRPESVAWGSWLPRVANWGRFVDCASGTEVLFTNTHCDYVPWSWSTGAWVLRAQQDARWDGSLQMLVGDFNARLDASPFRALLEPRRDGASAPPFREAREAARRNEGPEETFHNGDGETKWPGRLDHILYRGGARVRVERDITVTDHDGERYPSDHFPLVADLVLDVPGGRVSHRVRGAVNARG